MCWLSLNDIIIGEEQISLISTFYVTITWSHGSFNEKYGLVVLIRIFDCMAFWSLLQCEPLSRADFSQLN